MLVTMILIPTIVFNTFMVDLARLKLYGNQAVMAADNYGESVLSVYDNLLKDLYGLFAVTQDTEALKAVEAMAEYGKASFSPNTQKVAFKHLTPITDYTFSGFMPYKEAEVELSYKPVSNANLGNDYVLMTQVGDFMRFRIGQALFSGGETVLEAVQMIADMEGTAKVVDKKTDFDEEVGELLERIQAFYILLTRFYNYQTYYLKDVSNARGHAYEEFQTIASSPSYLLYKEYKEKETDIKAALNHQKNLKKDEKLSQEELDLIALNDRYNADPGATSMALKTRFTDAINTYEDAMYDDDNSVIDFANFTAKAQNLLTLKTNIKNQYETVMQKYNALQSAMNSNQVDATFKKELEAEIENIKKLINEKDASIQVYEGLASVIWKNKEINDDLEREAKDNVTALKNQMKAYMDLTPIPSNGTKINWSRYDRFTDYEKYKNLYEEMKRMFEDGSGTDAEKNAKAKKKEANKKKEEAEKTLNTPEPTDARDIPKNIPIGSTQTVGTIGLLKLFETAADLFDANSFSEGTNRLILKLYTAVYDFNMFSCRTTNKDSDKTEEGGTAADGASGAAGNAASVANGEEGKEKAASLTGYELSRKINYLYMAELEYIFGGFKSSQSNLNDARNKILAFRSVVNFTATYTVSEINSTIRALAEAATAVNPILGVAVGAALRLAVTALETAQDWMELRDGNGVVVIKTKAQDMTAYDQIMSLLGKSGDKQTSTAFKLDYEQYLMVMIIFMTTTEQVASRTGDLISLNVNTVDQNIGEKGTLSKLTFEIGKAHTAVNATCTVKLDFVVMPDSMASQFMDADTEALLEANRKNGYTFTVTRGY